MPTLKITVGVLDRLDQQTRRRIDAADHGADLDDAQPVLNVGSYDDLAMLLTAPKLELLEAIAEHDPASIRATAEVVGRDYRQVHRELTVLSDVGVLEFDGEGPGRPKKPVLPYDAIEVEIPLRRE